MRRRRSCDLRTAFGWLRRQARLSDLTVVGIAAVVSASLADHVGVATAVASGMGVIVLVNLLLRIGSSRD
jgi:hypothetical protein